MVFVRILFTVWIWPLCAGDQCSEPSTWRTASDCCASRDQALPMYLDVSEVQQHMKKHNMSSVWMAARLSTLERWTWVDGRQREPGFWRGFSPKLQCAGYDLDRADILPDRCLRTGGHVCELKGCQTCRKHSAISWVGCRQLEDKCFFKFCHKKNWYQARAHCLHHKQAKMDLAVAMDTGVKEILAKEPIGGGDWACSTFWLGLTGQTWVLPNTTYSVPAQLWADGEPSSGSECLVCTVDGKLNVRPCTTETTFVCVEKKEKKMTTETILGPMTNATTTQGGLSGGGIAGIAVGAVCLVLILCGFFIFYRFKTMRNADRRPPNHAATNTREEETSFLSPGTSSVKMNMLQRLLAETLHNKCKNINLWSWHGTPDHVPMDDIYVDVVLVQTKHGAKGRTHHPLADYTKVFAQISGDCRGQRVYLSGEPGIGKSTISRRICLDWSDILMGKSVNKTTEQKNVLRSFKHVIPIYLRDVMKDQALISVIKEQLNLEMRDAEELCHLIFEEQTSTLFILDGYDEFLEETSPEIRDLAHRKRFPYANLLITSRHPSASQFKEKDKPDVEVSLGGFSKEGVVEYIGKFFQESNTEREELLHKIDESDDLKYLSRYPAILLLMCCLWKETERLATTVTGFYLDFIKFSCCRYEQKNVPENEWTDPDKTIEGYKECLMQIGQVAAMGMAGERLQLSFSRNQVREVLDEKTWQLGFLVENEATGGRTVSFIHKTVQEFFLSFRIVHSDINQQNELMMHFCNSAKVFRESSMIVKFVSGLGDEHTKKQIEVILSGNEQDRASMHTGYQLSFLSEHRDATLDLPEVVSIDITDKYPGYLYIKYLGMNGAAVKKMTLWSVDEQHLRLLHYLNAPSLSYLFLGSGTAGLPCSVEDQYLMHGLESTLSKFPLKQLDIFGSVESVYKANDNDPSPDLLAMIRAIRQLQTLETLEFKWIPMTLNTIPTLTECLPESHIITLKIRRCRLTSETFWLILDKLPDCHKLVNLDVSMNELDNDIEKIINKSDKLSRLGTLNLELNKMSSIVAERVKRILSKKMTRLTVKVQ